MEYEAYVTIAVVIIAFILFATEYFTIDHIAISIIVVLVVSGVLSPEDGVKGFANPATLTVAAMFVLSDALLKTGIVESVAPLFVRMIKRSYYLSLIGITTITGFISAFINNTPVIATLIPIIDDSAKKARMPGSKFLIPLSYGAIFGGACTLIGTSTNLLVSGIAVSSGLRPFSMFLMAPLGIVLFLTGVIYLLLVAKRFLPDRRDGKELSTTINLKDYLTEIKIKLPEDGKLSEPLTIGNLFKKDGMDVYVDRVKRGDEIFKDPAKDFRLMERDHLLVRGEMEKIKNLVKNEAFNISTSLGTRSFAEEETRLIEIIVLPNSELVDKKLDNTDFFVKYRSKPLALRQRGKQKLENLGDVYIRAGDVILLQTNETGYELLSVAERKRQAPFVSLRETAFRNIKKSQLAVVAATIAAVIALASFEVLDIMTAAFGGIAFLVFTGHTNMERAYKAIDWKVVILLAGALSLGEAMEQSGLARIFAEWLVGNMGQQMGPLAIISLLYILTSLLTEVMSNNAAAALLAPISISLSHSFGADPIPFLMAITFAGSASFMTPIGYQTNTMVYSAGNYKFSDFVKLGAPLNIIFWIIATFLIPVFYPL